MNHSECAICGKKEQMPFTCTFCKVSFCTTHRLPENHQCLNTPLRTPLGRWNAKPSATSEKLKLLRKRYFDKKAKSPPDYQLMQKKYDDSVKHNRQKSKTKSVVLFILFIVVVSAIVIYRDEVSALLNFQTEPVIYFKSVSDLVKFIANDDLNEAKYTLDYTCVEFTRDFIQRAKASGHDCFTGYDLLYDTPAFNAFNDAVLSIGGYMIFIIPESGHRVVKTRIGDSDIIVDPQSDIIMLREQEHEWWGYLTKITFTVLYTGETN